MLIGSRWVRIASRCEGLPLYAPSDINFQTAGTPFPISGPPKLTTEPNLTAVLIPNPPKNCRNSCRIRLNMTDYNNVSALVILLSFNSYPFLHFSELDHPQIQLYLELTIWI